MHYKGFGMQIRKVGIIPKTYRNVERYRQILAILFKYGFDSMLDRIKLGSYFESGMNMISRTRREHVNGLSDYERLRMAFEELGPTFIKMGQILSTRSDLIPDDLVHELSKLQDNVPPFPISEVKEIIEQELGAPMDQYFAWMDDHPLAAASIGQVHRAQLNSGEEVIVKVQRPGIQKTIQVDLEILHHISELIEKNIQEAEIYKPTKIINEFARSIEKEINFKTEARHAERFAQQFAGKKHIYVPRIYKHMTTQRILTMEYVDGIKISDIDLLEESGLDRKTIAKRGAELTFEQIFEHGFFHADPHPGNICILPGNVICYLDFGMMDYVDKRSMEIFGDLLISYSQRDKSAIADAAMRIVEWDETPDRRALERDISGFIDLYIHKPLKDLHMGDVLQEFLQLFSRHHLRLPSDIFFIIKAMSEVESIGLLLDPDFDMIGRITPYMKNLQTKVLNPGRLMDGLLALSYRLKDLPLEIYDLVNQMKQGKVKIRFEHRGLEPLIFGINRSSNRIALSLVIASMIVGSSLVVMHGAGPFISGIPLLGFIGYSIAFIFCLLLLLSIWRSGKL